MNATLRVLKGHGTENDFLVIPDFEAVLSLSTTFVKALCNRQSGIGADGVLRAIRTINATEPDVRAQADEAEFFMDYHNADGSIAEMCGNGVRVFARFLHDAGLIGTDATIATRGGPRHLWFDPADDSLISVDMGKAAPRAERPTVSAVGLEGRYPGTAVDAPNPHVVVEVGDITALELIRLHTPPDVFPRLPDGQNVEFVVRTGPGRLSMRVHERGVGETRSCGTGICAAVAVAAANDAGPPVWQVDIPGGRCTVSWLPSGAMVLTGPAELVGELSIREKWLSGHR